MELAVLITKPQLRVDISPSELLSCSSKEEVMSLLQYKVRQALVHPDNFRVDAKVLTIMFDYWNKNTVEIVHED